jgi:hypothetical protein
MDLHFAEAAQDWNLEALYSDLASAKQKHLTPVEKLHLRGLLCGNSPVEIAEKLGKAASGVESDLSATIYRYVKSFLDKPDEKIGNWRNIAQWLDEAGYKTPSQSLLESLQTDKASAKVANINIGNNHLIFSVLIKVPTKRQPQSDDRD